MGDLEKLRGRLDQVDRRLLEVLSERLQTVAEIARVKAQGLPFLRDHERESELLARIEGWAREIGLDPRIPARTSPVFTTPHRGGALAHCLDLLAEHGVNLTKLESRPVPRRPWEYLVYADIEGSVAANDAAPAIAGLRRECPYLRVLGSYPSRTTAAGAVDRYSEEHV